MQCPGISCPPNVQPLLACVQGAQQQLWSWLKWLHARLMCDAFLQGVQQQLGVAQAERNSRTRQLQDLQSRLQELQSALRRAQDPVSHRWDTAELSKGD